MYCDILVIHRCTSSVQKKLCDYFMDTYGQLDMFSFHDEGHHVRLDEIYVPIQCVTHQQTTAGSNMKKIEHYLQLLSQVLCSYSFPNLTKNYYNFF